MCQYNEAEPQRYGDFDVLQRGDDERKTLLLDGFRFECQIDQGPAETYSWRWGYGPARSGMFTIDDLDRYAGSLSATLREKAQGLRAMMRVDPSLSRQLESDAAEHEQVADALSSLTNDTGFIVVQA